MKRVLKWTIPVDDHDHPIGTGPVVLVACQHGPGSVQVWTEESDGPDQEMRRARVYGTGHPVSDGDEHLGSVVASARGDFPVVWHVYGSPL